MKYRVLSHNILFGFRKDPETLELKRLTHTKNIVKKYKPDMLVLIEAGYGAPNETGIVFDYKKHFDYPHATYVPFKVGMGIMVLSKYPLLDAIPITGPQGSAIRVLVEVGSIPIDVIAAHPWFDAQDKEKINMLMPLLDIVAPPAIILGDFNALSHHDEYDKEVMEKSFKRFAGPEYKTLIKRLLDRKLLPLLETLGYVDVLGMHDSTYTIPTDSADDDKQSPLRMDFIMATPDLQVTKAEVVRGEDAENASDHYPVFAEFEL